MKHFSALILAIVLLAAVPAWTAEPKIAYVDLQTALNESESGKAAKEKIALKVKQYEGVINSSQEELKALKDELEKKALLLSEEARANKERDYQQKVKEFQRFTKDAQEELRQEDADFTRRILDGLLQTVEEIGAQEGYTLIMEKTESSILYADRAIDLTEKLVHSYNAAFRAQKGQ
ncbi:MAG: hypothetical protein C0617_02235 [Desulfuromonas sp.]|uniref:OmpH family outer membrane protein n=1 Tax=Desulfuromonas sp. TaxID=892 RepID=UPI000CC55CB4|nr:OmpH family outer membrane protein [Desulfuromonas sp.]PLX85978.1 MAG: hypothetical protein C0617_02235 [Desulfuromonas sp.]